MQLIFNAYLTQIKCEIEKELYENALSNLNFKFLYTSESAFHLYFPEFN